MAHELFGKPAFGSGPGQAFSGSCSNGRHHGHFTTGGMEDKMDSTFPPVRNPKIVPRSYRRLNST
jgi:hypothetical protein